MGEDDELKELWTTGLLPAVVADATHHPTTEGYLRADRVGDQPDYHTSRSRTVLHPIFRGLAF